MHSTERPYACPVQGCNQRFKKASARKTHVRLHSGERPYGCLVEGCDLHFSTVAIRNQHLQVHSNERPFACFFDDCTLRFKRESARDLHVQTHAVTCVYPCFFEGCTRRFKRAWDREVHRRVHEKIEACPCSDCRAGLATTGHAGGHQATLGEDRSYAGSRALNSQTTFSRSHGSARADPEWARRTAAPADWPVQQGRVTAPAYSQASSHDALLTPVPDDSWCWWEQLTAVSQSAQTGLELLEPGDERGEESGWQWKDVSPVALVTDVPGQSPSPTADGDTFWQQLLFSADERQQPGGQVAHQRK